MIRNGFVELAPLITKFATHSKFTSTKLFNLSTVAVPQSRTDLDSHADTCVVGCNSLITHSREFFGMPKFLNVVVYDPTLRSLINKPVVNAAVAYDYPHSGEVIILKINQAIHIDTMCNNFPFNMQLRMTEVKLFKCHKYLTGNPSELDHANVITPVDDVDNYFIILVTKWSHLLFPYEETNYTRV